MSIILGVTGGIATGKSTATSIFRQLGFPVVDADIIARKIVEPGKPGFNKLIDEFGQKIKMTDGTLNRKKLAEIIFNDERQRVLVNELLAGYIQSEILADIEKKRSNSLLVVVDIPLLFEEGYDQFVDQTAVIYCSKTIQLERLMKRDQLSEKEALARINSQWSIDKKKALADVVFYNQESKTNLECEIKNWLYKKTYFKK